MSGRVFVCTTCSRYAQPAAGEVTPGQRLVQAMKQHATACGSLIAVRAVECLNGCPHPCTAALRAPGKTIIRFCELTAEDAPALLEAAVRYAESPDGNVPPDALPSTLRTKVSDRVSLRVA